MEISIPGRNDPYIETGPCTADFNIDSESPTTVGSDEVYYQQRSIPKHIRPESTW